MIPPIGAEGKLFRLCLQPDLDQAADGSERNIFAWSTRAAAVIGSHSGARGPNPHLYPHSTYFPWDVSLHLLSHTALLSG
jgi:hypothetical protein